MGRRTEVREKLGMKPMGCALILGIKYQNEIKLNCGTPSWCLCRMTWFRKLTHGVINCLS